MEIIVYGIDAMLEFLAMVRSERSQFTAMTIWGDIQGHQKMNPTDLSDPLYPIFAF